MTAIARLYFGLVFISAFFRMLKHEASPIASPSYSRSPVHQKCSTVSETTPKLPRKERLASFSRLLNSEHHPFSSKIRKNRQINFTDLESSTNEMTPTISVLSSSPSRLQHLNSPEISYLSVDLHLLPNSPSTLKSPLPSSPNYTAPTPTKSPLYSANIKSSRLGRGSFGNVTLCVYKGSKFALKVVNGSSDNVGESLMLKIRHPHLVSILHVSCLSDKTYIFMEFAGNCNLQQILNTKSELDFQRKLSFCIQTLSGLCHCHSNQIVHADIKPANVIVSPFGICKLGDFGHSTFVDEKDDTRGRSKYDLLTGTAGYAAPEILRGHRPAFAADVYSFGVFLWQMLTKEIPFAGVHPHIIIYKVAHYHERPKFPDYQEDNKVKNYIKITEQCWHTDPQERPTAYHLLGVLKTLMSDVKKAK